MTLREAARVWKKKIHNSMKSYESPFFYTVLYNCVLISSQGGSLSSSWHGGNKPSLPADWLRRAAVQSQTWVERKVQISRFAGGRFISSKRALYRTASGFFSPFCEMLLDCCQTLKLKPALSSPRCPGRRAPPCPFPQLTLATHGRSTVALNR